MTHLAAGFEPAVRFERPPGVRVAAIGHGWVAYSPLSGETSLLNDESAAMLEVLATNGGCDTAAMAAALAEDTDLAPSALCELIEAGWPRLLQAGLVRRLNPAAS